VEPSLANKIHKIEAKDDIKMQDEAVGGVDVTLGAIEDSIKDSIEEAKKPQ
jgi:hypothetical protein